MSTQIRYPPLLNMSPRATTVTESPQKRGAIIEHAIATFAEDGFRNADVQVIADGARALEKVRYTDISATRKNSSGQRAWPSWNGWLPT